MCGSSLYDLTALDSSMMAYEQKRDGAGETDRQRKLPKIVSPHSYAHPSRADPSEAIVLQSHLIHNSGEFRLNQHELFGFCNKIEHYISVLSPGYEVLADLLWLKKQSLNHSGPIFCS